MNESDKVYLTSVHFTHVNTECRRNVCCLQITKSSQPKLDSHCSQLWSQGLFLDYSISASLVMDVTEQVSHSRHSFSVGQGFYSGVFCWFFMCPRDLSTPLRLWVAPSTSSLMAGITCCIFFSILRTLVRIIPRCYLCRIFLCLESFLGSARKTDMTFHTFGYYWWLRTLWAIY